MPSPKFLITGGSGLVGSMLARVLRSRYGAGNVLAADVRRDSSSPPNLHVCDITNRAQLEKLVVDNGVNCIVNQAAILSLAAEMNPHLAMKVNLTGFQNIMEVARIHGLRVFSASTIATFGPDTPRVNIPDITIQRPPSLYGTTKVSNELLGEFYHKRWGVDFRSIRYPAVICPDGEERGRVVDFAVQIFAGAAKSGHYDCDIAPTSCMPFQLVDDTVHATVQMLEAPNDSLTLRTYTIQSFAVSIEDLAKAIRKHIPDFTIAYDVNPAKQAIIDGFPDSVDDSRSKADWGWKPLYPLEECVTEVLQRLS